MSVGSGGEGFILIGDVGVNCLAELGEVAFIVGVGERDAEAEIDILCISEGVVDN